MRAARDPPLGEPGSGSDNRVARAPHSAASWLIEGSRVAALAVCGAGGPARPEKEHVYCDGHRLRVDGAAVGGAAEAYALARGRLLRSLTAGVHSCTIALSPAAHGGDAGAPGRDGAHDIMLGSLLPGGVGDGVVGRALGDVVATAQREGWMLRCSCAEIDGDDRTNDLLFELSLADSARVAGESSATKHGDVAAGAAPSHADEWKPKLVRSPPGKSGPKRRRRGAKGSGRDAVRGGGSRQQSSSLKSGAPARPRSVSPRGGATKRDAAPWYDDAVELRLGGSADRVCAVPVRSRKQILRVLKRALQARLAHATSEIDLDTSGASDGTRSHGAPAHRQAHRHAPASEDQAIRRRVWSREKWVPDWAASVAGANTEDAESRVRGRLGLPPHTTAAAVPIDSLGHVIIGLHIATKSSATTMHLVSLSGFQHPDTVGEGGPSSGLPPTGCEASLRHLRDVTDAAATTASIPRGACRLTRALIPMFGGCVDTVALAVCPASATAHESVACVRWAVAAGRITNHPRPNFVDESDAGTSFEVDTWHSPKKRASAPNLGSAGGGAALRSPLQHDLLHRWEETSRKRLDALVSSGTISAVAGGSDRISDDEAHISRGEAARDREEASPPLASHNVTTRQRSATRRSRRTARTPRIEALGSAPDPITTDAGDLTYERLLRSRSPKRSDLSSTNEDSDGSNEEDHVSRRDRVDDSRRSQSPIEIDEPGYRRALEDSVQSIDTTLDLDKQSLSQALEETDRALELSGARLRSIIAKYESRRDRHGAYSQHTDATSRTSVAQDSSPSVNRHEITLSTPRVAATAARLARASADRSLQKDEMAHSGSMKIAATAGEVPPPGNQWDAAADSSAVSVKASVAHSAQSSGSPAARRRAAESMTQELERAQPGVEAARDDTETESDSDVPDQSLDRPGTAAAAANVRAELARLHDQITGWRERCEAAETREAAALAAEASAKAESEAARRATREAEERHSKAIAQLRAEKEDAQRAAAVAESAAESERADAQRLRAAGTEAAAAMEAAQADVARRLQDANEREEALREAVRDAVQRASQASDEQQQRHSQESAKLRGEISRLRDKVSSLEESVERQRDQLHQKNQEHGAELERQREQRRADVDRLQARLAESAKQEERCNATIARLNNEVRRLDAAREAALEEVANARDEIEAVRAAADADRERAVSEMRESLRVAHAVELEEIKKAANVAMAKRAPSPERVDAATVRELQQDHAEAIAEERQRGIARVEGARAEAARQLEAVEHARAEAERISAAAEERARAAEREKAEAQEDAARVVHALTSAQAELEALRSQARSSQERVMTVEQELETAKEEARAAAEDAKAAHRVAEEAREQMQRAKDALRAAATQTEAETTGASDSARTRDVAAADVQYASHAVQAVPCSTATISEDAGAAATAAAVYVSHAVQTVLPSISTASEDKEAIAKARGVYVSHSVQTVRSSTATPDEESGAAAATPDVGSRASPAAADTASAEPASSRPLDSPAPSEEGNAGADDFLLQEARVKAEEERDEAVRQAVAECWKEHQEALRAEAERATKTAEAAAAVKLKKAREEVQQARKQVRQLQSKLAGLQLSRGDVAAAADSAAETSEAAERVREVERKRSEGAVRRAVARALAHERVRAAEMREAALVEQEELLRKQLEAEQRTALERQRSTADRERARAVASAKAAAAKAHGREVRRLRSEFEADKASVVEVLLAQQQQAVAAASSDDSSDGSGSSDADRDRQLDSLKQRVLDMAERHQRDLEAARRATAAALEEARSDAATVAALQRELAETAARAARADADRAAAQSRASMVELRLAELQHQVNHLGEVAASLGVDSRVGTAQRALALLNSGSASEKMSETGAAAAVASAGSVGDTSGGSAGPASVVKEAESGGTEPEGAEASRAVDITAAPPTSPVGGDAKESSPLGIEEGAPIAGDREVAEPTASGDSEGESEVAHS